MKRALYSFFFVFLMSCGTSPMVSHKVSVYLNNGEVTDGFLLAMRDNTLEIEVPPIINRDTTINGYKKLISFTDINFVRLRPDGVKTAVGFGGVVGCIGGMFTGCALSSPKEGDHPGLVDFALISQVGYGFLGGAIGLGVGSFTGAIIQLETSRYYLYKQSDLEYLRKVAVK